MVSVTTGACEYAGSTRRPLDDAEEPSVFRRSGSEFIICCLEGIVNGPSEITILLEPYARILTVHACCIRLFL